VTMTKKGRKSVF